MNPGAPVFPGKLKRLSSATHLLVEMTPLETGRESERVSIEQAVSLIQGMFGKDSITPHIEHISLFNLLLVALSKGLSWQTRVSNMKMRFGSLW
jgi:hypothetical protein